MLARTPGFPSLESHGTCNLESIILILLLSSLIVFPLNLMPEQGLCCVGVGVGGSASPRTWTTRLACVLRACCSPHSLDSSRLLHPSNVSSRESMDGVDFRAGVGRPAYCGWRISGPLPFASKVTWCMCCFQVRREGAAGMEEGREGGVESGSQRMYELIPEIPSGLAQLPSFQGQLP